MIGLDGGMKLFHPDNFQNTDEHKRIYAYSEIAYTVVDVSAALFFVVGSILFFSASTTTLATWLFLIGSILFGLRPTIRLGREILFARDVEPKSQTPSTGAGGS